jgi:hypothetical protein
MSEIDFKLESGGLDNDIAHIDSRLDRINANIVLLQSNVDRITQLILTANPTTQPNSNQPNKSQLYSVQADILRTLALYNDNYQRLLDLKFKYRSEHNDFRLKTARFNEIELKRNIQEADISYRSVITALNKLSEESTSTTTNSTPRFQLNFDKDEEM